MSGDSDFHLVDRERFSFSTLITLVNFFCKLLYPVSHLVFESWGDEDVGGNS